VVTLAEKLGAETMLYLALENGETLTVRADGLARVQPGERVTVGIDPRSCHLFDGDGTALVSGSLLDA
jgi:ABC-type sugar transport system ATPase subunit